MHDFPGWTFATLLAVTVSVWLMPDLKEAVPAHDAAVAVWPIMQQRPVQWFFASLFFHVLSHIGIYAFFSLYLDELGYSKTLIGLLWALSVVAEVVWFFTQSRWLPRLSLTAWLLFCAAAMLVRMVVTAGWADVLWLLFLAQALHALTFAAHHTVCIALLSQHFPGRLRARGQALYTVIGYGFTGLLGALGGGVLSSRFGLASVFWMAAVASVLAGLCAWGGWRWHQVSQGQPVSTSR